MTAISNETLAIIAGGGHLPQLVLEGARNMGLRVVGVGFAGETDPALAHGVDAWQWQNLGQLGKLIAFCKKQGVGRIVMAGKIHKARAVDLRPDWRAAKLLWKVKNTQDDVLLRAITGELESEGMAVVSAVDFLPHLRSPEGVLTRRGPTSEEQADIDFGWPMARQIGALDIGQCIVVRKRTTVAVEGLEGTDATILRAGELVGPGCVVIKLFKPIQDVRLDLPAVGPKTIQTMIQAKASCLALEAGRSLFIHLEESLTLADKAGISVVGLRS
ncbi:LpxI family protein [Desulfonatronum parangueonense]